MADAYPVLAVDPNEEELTREWTLSAGDLEQVHRCRGDSNRHRFAVQLCALRTLGRFVDDVAAVPVRIANHIGGQIGRPPVLFIEPTERPATATEHEHRLRVHLGYQPFDEDRLKRWLDERANEGTSGVSLFDGAIRILREWKVEVPPRSSLERLVRAASARGEEVSWQRLYERMSPEFCAAIDGLIAVADRDRRSMLFQLKQYPPEAKPRAILTYLERAALFRSVGAGAVDFTGFDGETIGELADMVRRYDVDDLKRFGPAKRYALIACFLAEAQKTTLDHLVEMHRAFLTGMSRRARNAVEKRHREVRSRATKGLATVLQAMEIVLDRSRPPAEVLDDMFNQVDEETLRAAVVMCREFHQLGDHGYIDEMLARHSHLKQYLPTFLELPFRGEPGTEPLVAALGIARKLEAGDRLPGDAPIDFATGVWRAALQRQRDRRVWEIALAFAVRDALRSGNLYLEASRHHVSFWNLVHDKAAWERERDGAYRKLSLPPEAATALGRLRTEFDQAVGDLAAGLGQNPFASLVDGRLAYSRDDADEEPTSAVELRRVIETRIPRIRIEDLLVEVDGWCGFTRELVPLGGYRPRVDNLYPALLAALVAHGTNLGIATMAQSTKGVSVDVLHHLSDWYLHADSLKGTNRMLVNYHHQLATSAVWGDGLASSSDGQRFGIQAPSLLASFYPRYFGYYDRAVTVYTHVSNQFSVFAGQVISCAPREAVYVLDGLLENDTVLRPREHYTDTHGFTEQLFGLCHLLGYSFMPRLKDLKDQQLYRLDRSTAYGDLDSVFRGTVDVALIAEQWDPLVRVAASLRNRTAPAHVVLDRLAASSPSDRLAKALSMLGRVVKTIHILRYSHDAQLRKRVRKQLNRGESRHALARRLFFANQGAFRIGDYHEIMNKVTALSVLSNAVLVWNTVRIGEIVAALEATGNRVANEDLARVSPLANAHVIPSGTYRFPRTSGRQQPLE